MDITITLTDEQVAAIAELSQSRRGEMTLRRMGLRRNVRDMGMTEPVDPNLPVDQTAVVTTFVNTMFQGLAEETVRRNNIMAQRRVILDGKEPKDPKVK